MVYRKIPVLLSSPSLPLIISPFSSVIFENNNKEKKEEMEEGEQGGGV